jgi:hypothetical protein
MARNRERQMARNRERQIARNRERQIARTYGGCGSPMGVATIW